MSKVAPEPIVEKEKPVSSGEKKVAEEKTLETKVDEKTIDNVANTTQNVNNDKGSLDEVEVDKQDTKIDLETNAYLGNYTILSDSTPLFLNFDIHGTNDVPKIKYCRCICCIKLRKRQ